MDLTEAQRGVCAAIVRAPEAWSRRDDMVEGWGAETLESLVGLGVLVNWSRPDYSAVTLTPWGTWLLKVQLDEVWGAGMETTTECPDSGRPLATETIISRVLIETPRWTEGDVSTKPIKLPKFGRIGRSLVNPESIEAPTDDGPEYLLDEDGDPVEIMGRKVLVDQRLR